MQMMSNLKNNEMFLYPIKLKFATKLIHKMNLYSEDENSLDIEEDRLNRYLPEKFKERYSVHHKQTTIDLLAIFRKESPIMQ
jgi:hypothetical protein